MIEEIKKTNKEIKEKTATLMLAAFALVAALAWNDAVQTLFNIFFPENNGVIGKFIYAIIITVVVVIISRHLQKILHTEEEQ